MKLFTKTLILSTIVTASVQATTIDFDSFATGSSHYITLVNPSQTAAIGHGFQATSLGGWDIIISDAYNTEWAGGVSSDHNTMGLSGKVRFDRIDSNTFDFNSGFFTRIYPYSPMVLSLEGWSGGIMTHSASLNLTGPGQVLTYNWTHLDYLIVNNNTYDWLGLDDLTVDSHTSVPDGGATLAMLGIAIATFAALRRRSVA